MGWYYRNRTTGVQTINLNSGRSIHVQPGEEVELQDGEESSDEIVGKVRGSRPTGGLRESSLVNQVNPPVEGEQVEASREQPEATVGPSDAFHGGEERR